MSCNLRRVLMQSLLAIVGCLALNAGTGYGAIIGVTGQGNILIPDNTPNTGATANFFNDTGVNRRIHGWNELQNVRLQQDITVDIVNPGFYGGPFTSANATIAAGTMVSSHLLYFDPLRSTQRQAEFTFDSDIIGIIVLSDIPGNDRFLNSDFLGNPLTAYPGAHFNLRGVEFGPETMTLSADRRTLHVCLVASDPGDQVRVITRCDVPEPASALLGLVGLIGAVVGRRSIAGMLA